MSLEPVFDSPQWTFRVPPEGTEDSIALIDVHMGVSGKRPDRVKRLILPTEFFKFAKDVLQVRDMDEVEIYLERDRDRHYLTVYTNTGVLDLWYYTKSNLPAWVEV